MDNTDEPQNPDADSDRPIEHEIHVSPTTLRSVSFNDYLRPQRWNWNLLLRGIDRGIEKSVRRPLEAVSVRSLRFFYLDGIFATISENFYASFIVLFALAFGAEGRTIGLMTAVANLCGTIALFPGAAAIEKTGVRKPLILASGGGVGRLALLALAVLPFFTRTPPVTLIAIIALHGVRAFMGNFANPAWTSLVADVVPNEIRGRYFSRRNQAMALAAMLAAPLAGRIIGAFPGADGLGIHGYQIVFSIAFVVGILGTVSFAGIKEPIVPHDQKPRHARGDLRRALRENPRYIGFVAGAFIWNLSIQISAPFFNVYLVQDFGATASIVGINVGIFSIAGLIGQRVFGPLLDARGTVFLQKTTGFMIPFVPLFWIFLTRAEQSYALNALAGFLWSGYNLANFNYLLESSPKSQRARAVALYQTVVFASAVIGPLIGGLVSDLVGYRPIFALSGLGRMIGIVVFAVTHRIRKTAQENRPYR